MQAQLQPRQLPQESPRPRPPPTTPPPRPPMPSPPRPPSTGGQRLRRAAAQSRGAAEPLPRGPAVLLRPASTQMMSQISPAPSGTPSQTKIPSEFRVWQTRRRPARGPAPAASASRQTPPASEFRHSSPSHTLPPAPAASPVSPPSLSPTCHYNCCYFTYLHGIWNHRMSMLHPLHY